MPGAVPLTSSQALNNATLPFVMALANNGLAALEQDPHLANGLNVQAGKIMHPAVIEGAWKPVCCVNRARVFARNEKKTALLGQKRLDLTGHLMNKHHCSERAGVFACHQVSG